MTYASRHSITYKGFNWWACACRLQSRATRGRRTRGGRRARRARRMRSSMWKTTTRRTTRRPRARSRASPAQVLPPHGFAAHGCIAEHCTAREPLYRLRTDQPERLSSSAQAKAPFPLPRASGPQPNRSLWPAGIVCYADGEQLEFL